MEKDSKDKNNDGRDWIIEKIDSQIKEVEKEVEKQDTKITNLDTRLTITEMQVGRLSSHVESEVGLARTDLLRIEEKLFSKEDSRYGGRIGELTKDIDNFKMRMAYGAGFVAAVMLAMEIYRMLK